MRKLLWMVFLFGAYLWMMTSGREQIFIEQGKTLYRAVIAWFEDAEIDYQISNQPSRKAQKRTRRWD